MFFSNIIKRRLESLLEPWLQEEPELELKLGLINSCAIAKNLRFDTSVLNGLVDEPTRWSFEDVTVEHLSIRFSNWSVPAFAFEVRGVRVTLSVGELKDEGCSGQVRKASDKASDELKKALSSIDPEGSTFHDILERISVTTPSRSRIKTSLLNLVLKHCQLQMHDISLQVQFPILNDSFACLSELKELNAESQYIEYGCLLRGLVGALFLPLKESSFIIDGNGFEIGFKRKDRVKLVFSSTDLFTCISLNDLQLVDFNLRVPELSVSVSPIDLLVLTAFGELSSKESTRARNGRQLWKLAASRIGHLIPAPRLSLHKLVGFVGLWLRYVNAYDYLLSLVGYSAYHTLKRSIVRMSQDKIFFSSVKHYWKVISDIEKELPAEAIAQARRIARYRAALNVRNAGDTCAESFINSHYKFFCKSFLLLAFVWKVIGKVFYSIIHFSFMRNFLAPEPKGDGHFGLVSEDSVRFILNLGRIQITVSPIDAVQPSVNEKLESQIGISFLDFLSFCLSVDSLLLIYIEDICEQSLSISCGQLRVKSSSFMGAPAVGSSAKSSSSSVKGQWNGRVDDLETILWSEPAQMFFLPETSKSSAADHAEGACDLFLEKFLGEMWLSWKRAGVEFEESEMQYSENPCLLCEIKSLLMYPGLESSDSGIWKCGLTVGKLNLVLGYSSMLSMALLLRQTQHVLCLTEDNGRAKVLSHSPRTIEDPLKIDWDSKYKCYASGIKMAMHRMLPQKQIQLGALIAGPHIQISFKKEFNGGNEEVNYTGFRDGFHLALDVHNIEVAVSPTSKSDLASLPGWGSDDAEPDCLRLKDFQIIEIPKSDGVKYMSQGWISLCFYLRVNGLNAYLEDLAEKQQSQIFVAKPISVHLSSFREYLHSFGTTVNAFSVALCGVATGFTVLSYMDELYVFFQAVEGLFSSISYAFSRFDSIGCVPFQKNLRQDIVFAEPGNGETTAKGAPWIYSTSLFLVNGTFKLKSMDIIFHNSRISNNVERMITFDSIKKLAGHDLLDSGIWVSVQQSCVDISCEEEKLEVLTELSGIQIVIFRYQNQIGESTDHSELRNLLQQSLNSLYEISLSNCIFTVWLGPPQNVSSSGDVNNTLGSSTSGGKTSYMVESSTLTPDSKRSSIPSINFVQRSGVASNTPALASCHWLLITVALGEIIMARCSVKNVLVGAHQLNKLQLLLSIGGEFPRISWTIQGGFCFLETTALAVFIHCFASYIYCVRNILCIEQSSGKHIERAQHDLGMNRLNDHLIEESAQETLCTSRQANWELLEAFTIDLSQFSLVLVLEDESGGVRELVVEVDFHLNLELENMRRKFIFDISRLSILSQVLHESVKNDIQIPHFSSVTSNDLSSHSVTEDPAVPFWHRDEICPVDDASCSRNPASQEEFSVKNCVSDVFRLSHQNYILKHLGAFILAEKPVPGSGSGSLHLNQVWVGSGSVSGFDIALSLTEIQMILSTVELFSEVFSKETTSELKQRNQPSNQEFDNGFEAMVPNGAIVAIQDVHQHMYFTVEGGENKYSLVGTIHYSLVGERALFRVKYHNQQRWKSSVSWFSLMSLHAKNDSGEPLRLNCHPGSGFVDISSTSDSGWALWKAVSCEPDNYKNDIDWEPYTQLVKNTFCLVNKKNDCGVAFVDGVPEFVRKPGNPFKLKVFHDLCVARDVVMPDSYSVEASATSMERNACMDKEKISVQSGKQPCIDITFDKVALTIVHEHLDTKDLFPLLRGCINDTHLIVQILSTKTRVVGTSRAVLDHFDAQRNLWREVIHPVEICIFYRFSFQTHSSEIIFHGAPVHFYCRTKELNISLTELSLDILLFVIGKLDLAGPYSVRSSKILANCCKVENQSSLNLLCHFYNKESVTIARKQSASIFLRHSALANQLPEIASVVSIQLAIPGSLSTSSIHLSLLEAQALAWRTRIMSLHDSSTYPGPFVVVDISRKTEDGLTIVVSPLLRIHNETEFPMELRFRRPQLKEDEFAYVLLKAGDTIDDSMTTFDATNLSGGSKKALMSLSVGNFLLSFRPEITDSLIDSKKSLSVEWSDDLKGGKAVRISGIFDKLNYGVRKALSVGSVKDSFSTAHCALKSEDSHLTNMHFLIQSIGRDVTVLHPDKSGDGPINGNSSIALQEQKEIFLLPTVRVSNFLHSEIHVLLTESDRCTSIGGDNIGKQATISCGSTVDFYANPAIIYFNVTLTAFSSSCKPVNSSDWIKKLLKQKNNVNCLDINLDFGGGKYFASLRLSRGRRGILEAAIFTSYALKNDTDFSLFCFAPNQKPLSRDDTEKFGSSIPPELGLLLPPKSIRSWFIKSNKVRLKLLEDNTSAAMLDLDALSGIAELSLEREEGSGVKYITKFGVSLGPSLSKVTVPSQTVSVVPRYIISNESEESVMVRQCYLEDDMAGIITISTKQKTMLQLRNGVNKRTEFSLFDNFIKKHRNANDDSVIYIQFRLNGAGLSWSGPVCITSLGRFFLKFRKQQSNQASEPDNNITEFAVVHVVEEGSTLVLHFHKQPNIILPYRIENRLRDASLTYYQKDSNEPEVLGSECSVDYVWDDLTLPRKLVLQINDMHLLREINLDKVRAWKLFLKPWQHRGLTSHLLFDKKSGDLEMVKVGYEVYADGPTRVLRICEFSDSRKGDTVFQSCAKIQLRVSHFAVHLLEHGKQDVDEREPSLYTPILVARLGNICLASVFTDQQKYNQINVQSLNVDQKWVGAPFAAMLRRHQLDYSDSNDYILKIVVVLLSTRSNVKQVRYSSIILQPVDLNLDEETLMRIVPFWRTSLSKSNTPSQQYYLDHFEIHPIKIFANFLPGDSFSSYSSAQETLRSLLHSVVKVPSIKNMVVELNGVLVTHALITMRELLIRCAQHYSWYAMRAVYIAKGSPLLPPAFASIFDDLASSSLDVFFDPSRGLMNLPGLTLGTFKFISKCIDGKGFSGTKRYFGDLGKTLRTAGSNVLFAAVTEISDSVLKGAEASGFNGMVSGFHQGILKLAMEPSLLGTALMEGGPDRKIKLDRSPGVDELYIEGYLQAMLDMMYKQEYLRVRVIDNQVFLKNLPPNSSLIDEIMDRVKGFLVSKALLKGDPSTTSHPLRHLRGESEWKIGPTVLTLCEHLFVSFAIRMLRKQAGKFMANITRKKEPEGDDHEAIVLANPTEEQHKGKFIWNWGIGKFLLSGIVAYIDGRLCRCIPNPVARRIVSGFLLSLLDKNDDQ